jgi:hypothetical protein
VSEVIKIPFDLYSRLGTHAKGFETPADVIERILNFYEGKRGDVKPVVEFSNVELPAQVEIIYYPPSEAKFKQALLKTKVAYILLHKIDGTAELKEWNALSFGVDSSVSGNLRSGYLRNWKKKGIVRAEVSTERKDLLNNK